MDDHPGTPVAIGGVGGSGTRLIARLLMELGFFMGEDLNESNDNLWFTLLFKHVGILSVREGEFGELVRIFVDRMTGAGTCNPSQAAQVTRLALRDRPDHPASWLKDRADSLLAAGVMRSCARPWGWKEPNTHVVMDRLPGFLPGMKYIHVMRNGLDMAHSANQNQLRLWGRHFLDQDFEVSPRWSLKYWHAVHRRILRVCETMGDRFLLLNYDRLCQDPHGELPPLLKFLGLAPSMDAVSRLAELVRAPVSIGRFKRDGVGVFDPEDVAFARRLGFDVDDGLVATGQGRLR